MNNSKYKKGFTLIELVAVMALMGIVATLAFSLYFYGQQSFYVQEEQFDVQSNVRIVTDYIVNTTRNATELKIIPDTNAKNQKNRVAYDDYNFIYLVDGSLFCHFTDGTEIEIGDSITEISFSVVSDDTLGIHVKATDNYESDVSVKLINISMYSNPTDAFKINNNKPPTALRFKLPE